MITLPKNWKTNYNTIRERSKDLVEAGIWEGISISELDRWRNNFKTEDEKYFSACILDGLIFRTKKQTVALIFQLLTRSIPNYLRRTDTKINYKDFLAQFTQDLDEPHGRFVLCIKPGDTGTKSTAVILRLMKREFGIKDKWIIKPSDIEGTQKRGIKDYIFIDDFLGTGQQFTEIVKGWKLSEKIDVNTRILFAPLTAHVEGIESVEGLLPAIKVASTEILDKSHSFFNSFFETDINTASRARVFYQNMIESRGFEADVEGIFGFGNLELTYGFDHACPDNSLPILYHSVLPNSWFRLLKK